VIRDDELVRSLHVPKLMTSSIKRRTTALSCSAGMCPPFRAYGARHLSYPKTRPGLPDVWGRQRRVETAHRESMSEKAKPICYSYREFWMEAKARRQREEEERRRREEQAKKVEKERAKEERELVRASRGQDPTAREKGPGPRLGAFVIF
jgi:hypothetical protein